MKTFFEQVKSLILFIITFAFIVILYFRNQTIEELTIKLKDCNNIVYVHKIDTIRDTTVVYKEIIKPLPSDTEYVEIVEYIEKNLTPNDSLEIGRKVINWITDYNTIKLYDNIYRDDSIAFVRFKTSVYKNNLVDPTLIMENRLPMYKYVTEEPKTQIYAGFGFNTNGPLVNAGVLTKSNILYQVQADPIHGYYGGSINFKLYQFKK